MSNAKHETLAAIRHQFREVTKMIPHEEVAVSKMDMARKALKKAAGESEVKK